MGKDLVRALMCCYKTYSVSRPMLFRAKISLFFAGFLQTFQLFIIPVAVNAVFDGAQIILVVTKLQRIQYVSLFV